MGGRGLEDLKVWMRMPRGSRQTHGGSISKAEEDGRRAAREIEAQLKRWEKNLERHDEARKGEFQGEAAHERVECSTRT